MFEVLKNQRRLFTIATVALVVTFALFLLGNAALAQEEALETVGEFAGLPQTDIRYIVAQLIRAAIGLVGVIFVVLVIYGGFLFMTSGGDGAKVAKAKAVLRNGAIGLVIVLASYSIASFILNALINAGLIAPGGVQAPAGVEVRSGSLGSGILEDHYPRRNAINIPRNTKIIVTFKEPMSTASFGRDQLEGAGTPEVTDDVWTLETDNILIYETAAGDGEALEPEEVTVQTTADQAIWVFDPVELLGNAVDDTNYTVELMPDIETADGLTAFSSDYPNGYEWTFEVSTEVDLTAPYITSIAPPDESTRDRNIVIQVNFNEAIDPTSATGQYNLSDALPEFTNLLVEDADAGLAVEGVWSISNAYKTVEFVTFDSCGDDPCGDTIYCLPGDTHIDVTVSSATVGSEPPQAVGFPYDGVVDLAGNSLDGNEDGIAEGPDTDNYLWSFITTNDVNDIVPAIYSILPGEEAENVDLDQPVEIVFMGSDDPNWTGVTIQSSTISNRYLGITASPLHELWYVLDKVDLYEGYQETPPYEGAEPTATKAVIDHAMLLESTDLLTQFYYPSITSGVKSSYQICMFPAQGPAQVDPVNTAPPFCAVDSNNPSCCNLVPGDECVIP